ITALGRIQPAGGVIPVFGPPGDRIAKLFPLKVGDELTKDVSPVAELASYEERNQQVKVATTRLDEARKALAAAQHAGKQKILAAQAELNQAQANKESALKALDAKLDYLALQEKTAAAGVKRLKDLKDKGVAVAAEDIEKAELLAAQAVAESRATDALRKKTEITYVETEKTAKAKLEAAKAKLA